VLGIRSKNLTVRNAARRVHHAVGNPLQMRSAGTPGTYASVIRHRGRTTGRTYETPVWAVPTEDGFVIAIVYGPRTDWLKNALASGAAAIVHEGGTYPVDWPEIVPMESGRPYFPAMTRRTHLDFASTGVCGSGGSTSRRPPPRRALRIRNQLGGVRLPSTRAIGCCCLSSRMDP
jgi:hypothetical protein